MTASLRHDAETILLQLGVPAAQITGGNRAVRSPIDGSVIAHVHDTTADAAHQAIASAHTAFQAWRNVPAPRRGELIRLFGEELRAHKDGLGRLVSLEVGKITSEGLGEVQEMIDICDFAVGLSRQLYGLTIATERSEHRMMETWHPLGVTGIISAFNFPVAVWSWNAALALVCGNSIVWKPSEKTPLTALATHALLGRAIARFGAVPEGLAVEADAALLSRALANLVRNALRYAGDAGPITVTALTVGLEAVITVEDCGAGVPADTLGQLGEPFFRPELARSRDAGGVGLGLAIVRGAVEACRGSVRFSNREPRGFRAEVRLAQA